MFLDIYTSPLFPSEEREIYSMVDFFLVHMFHVDCFFLSGTGKLVRRESQKVVFHWKREERARYKARVAWSFLPQGTFIFYSVW